MLHAGTQRLTADGAISSSGAAVTIYSVTVRSSGAACSVILNNGTSAAGDDFDTIDVAAANTSVHREYPRGRTFPSGCFVDIDANTSYVSVDYNTI